ncbi:MAG TPA: sugar phosphate nucleotidyltransferase, partial [Candidatus Nanoarchaeia archaeon]|nr:sugar phosphate nucleotidyltransferase [Candidatus Nanoarchaeia archaeon]
MQAVLLAAGKSTRAYPLTLTIPKPLLKVANKTLLEHNLKSLAGLVDEVIIIVGYKKGLIQKKFGNKYQSIRIKYITQKQQLGTAHALYLAKDRIKGKFILMMGDDIYSKIDIAKCLKYVYSILVQKVKNPEIFGVIKHKNNILIDFVEKPKFFVSNLANTALYVLDKKIFPCIEKTKKSERGEIEMPDAVKLLSKENKIHCVKAARWIPIGYP